MTPIIIENNTLRMIDGTLIATGVPETREITSASMIPEMTPIMPPRLVKTTASVRNWARIRLFLAPSA